LEGNRQSYLVAHSVSVLPKPSAVVPSKSISSFSRHYNICKKSPGYTAVSNILIPLIAALLKDSNQKVRESAGKALVAAARMLTIFSHQSSLL